MWPKKTFVEESAQSTILTQPEIGNPQKDLYSACLSPELLTGNP